MSGAKTGQRETRAPGVAQLLPIIPPLWLQEVADLCICLERSSPRFCHSWLFPSVCICAQVSPLCLRQCSLPHAPVPELNLDFSFYLT